MENNKDEIMGKVYKHSIHDAEYKISQLINGINYEKLDIDEHLGIISSMQGLACYLRSIIKTQSDEDKA